MIAKRTSRLLSAMDSAAPSIQPGAAERRLSLAKTTPGGQVVDLSVLIRPQSQFDDHSPAPPASAPPLSLRWPPPARPGEPRSAPATRRIQTNGASAQAAHDGPPLVGRAGHSLGRLEAGSGHRVAQHHPAVAEASLPRALDGALRSASAGPSAYQRRDRRPHQKNGRDESLMGCAENPR